MKLQTVGITLAMICLLAASAVTQDPPPLDLDALEQDTTDAGLVIPEEPAPEPRGVGYHEKVAAFHNRDITYKLFVPDAYEDPAHADVRFPLLVVQNPGGRPNIKQYMDWAQAHGVVIVGINKVSNGMKQHLKPRIQTGVLKDLEAIGLRIHPQLKYTIGMSGGSADGERFTRHSAPKFAGVVLQGAGRIPADEKRRHLAVAVLFGTLDDWVNVAKVNEQVAAARDQGQAMMLKLYPKMGHKWAPMEDQQAALTWMLRTTKLTNPYLSDEEKAAYREQMLAQMRGDAQIEDPLERADAAMAWLRVKPLAETEEAVALGLAWVTAALAHADTLDDPSSQQAFLVDFAHRGKPLPESMNQAALNVFSQRLESLAADDAARSARSAQTKLLLTRDQEAQAGREVAKLREVIAGYQSIVDAYPGTRWAEEAAAEIKPLEKWIEKNPDGGGIN